MMIYFFHFRKFVTSAMEHSLVKFTRVLPVPFHLICFVRIRMDYLRMSFVDNAA